tara:strand:+ start:5160 stop:5435 length:276 start_codon:yes stop_codon:yes gene_type:complete
VAAPYLLEVEYPEEVGHAVGRAVGRLVAEVDLMLRRQLRHDRVDNLQQLERRLLVKRDARQLHVEGRLIEPLDDELLRAHPSHRVGLARRR